MTLGSKLSEYFLGTESHKQYTRVRQIINDEISRSEKQYKTYELFANVLNEVGLSSNMLESLAIVAFETDKHKAHLKKEKLLTNLREFVDVGLSKVLPTLVELTVLGAYANGEDKETVAFFLGFSEAWRLLYSWSCYSERKKHILHFESELREYEQFATDVGAEMILIKRQLRRMSEG